MKEFSESIVEWLCLPRRAYSKYTGVSQQYGAMKVVAGYCHMCHIPAKMRGRWQHGWLAEHLAVDPRFVVNEPVEDHSREVFWVARKDQEAYLRGHGYEARAIGLPIAYAPDQKFTRKPNSLLVMPAHSLDFTAHSWRFGEYVKAIEQIRRDFSEVVACVHPSCVRKGYWVDEFQKAGIPVILGAEVTDRNALARVKSLMSQFEFVTTNTYGSCIAYASAFGAKVSVYGPYCGYNAEDFQGATFFRDNPGMLEKVLPLLNELAVRASLPEVFCHPKEALARIDWGLHQIGFSNRLTPEELRAAFGWEGVRHNLKSTWFFATSSARRMMPRLVKLPAKRLLATLTARKHLAE